MRKVIFKRWIPKQYIKEEGKNYTQPMPGTGCFEPEFSNSGFFHTWGSESQDSGETMVMDTIALVELPDGSIESVYPHALKFVDPYQELHISYDFANGVSGSIKKGIDLINNHEIKM